MLPWMNYHHLYYFKVIAEEGSVSKAAQKIHVGQPTLSAQLKQFEETLKIQLFDRQHKKLILTEQGKIALEYAQNIFKMGSEMMEVLNDRLIPTRTHLQIGALDSIPKQIILDLAKKAYQLGNCQISLMEGKSDEILRELSAHHIDLFVTSFVPTGSEIKGLIHRSLSKKAVSIYGSTQFKKLKNKFPQSLIGQPLVMPTFDSKLRYDLEHYFQTRKINVDTIAETQDITLKTMLAHEGLGLIPSGYPSAPLIEIGKLEGVYEEFFLVSAVRKHQNPIADLLMNQFSI